MLCIHVGGSGRCAKGGEGVNFLARLMRTALGHVIRTAQLLPCHIVVPIEPLGPFIIHK